MNFQAEEFNLEDGADWLLCQTCGTQFPTSSRQTVKTCHICDDPRQYVPPQGQTFTSLEAVRQKHHNEFLPFERDPRLVSIRSVPQVGIGQRAILIRAPEGNVLWDCISLLDDDTIKKIGDMGGLKAIVISHPHYYSTHVLWARAFSCPVYLASEDMRWRTLTSSHQVPLTEPSTAVLPSVRAIKLGGHFPGSLVCQFEHRLLIADTLVTTPAGLGRWEVDGNGDPRVKPPGLNTYSFLWSIPNMIPLRADELASMWDVLRRVDFSATHGAFVGTDVEDGAKARVLESMKIQASFMGNQEHAIMKYEA